MIDQFEFKKYLYYYIVGIASVMVLVLFPLIGTNADIKISLPSTISGWIVYIITKVLIVALNMIIFYCFIEQGKINVRNNENYKTAVNIINNAKIKELKPMSPKEWESQQYKIKGSLLVITSLISSFALTNAVLTYDYVSLLSYSIIILFGIITGIIQMKKTEAFYTNDFYQYAMLYKENKNKINKIKEKIKCSYTMEKNIATLKNKLDRIKKISNTSLKKKVFSISSV